MTAVELGPIPKPYLGYICWYFLPGPADSGLICRKYIMNEKCWRGGGKFQSEFGGQILLICFIIQANFMFKLDLSDTSPAHQCHLESISIIS